MADKKTTVTVRMNGEDVEVPMEQDGKGLLYAPGGLELLPDADPSAQDAMNEAMAMRNVAEANKRPALPRADPNKVGDIFMPANVVDNRPVPTGLPEVEPPAPAPKRRRGIW